MRACTSPITICFGTRIQPTRSPPQKGFEDDPRTTAEGSSSARLGGRSMPSRLTSRIDSSTIAVTRTPLPLVYADDVEARRRSWYFATSNNVLVHAPAGERPSVFIPTYAHGPFADTLAATDRRNAEIWEALGYAVVALGVLGIGNSIVDVNAVTIMQRAVPDAVLGRARSAHSTGSCSPRWGSERSSRLD